MKDDNGAPQPPADDKNITSMDDLTANEEFPEPRENAIEAVRGQKPDAAAPSPTAPGVQLNKDGSIKQKRGRKPGQKSAIGISQQKTQAQPEQVISSIHAAAVVSGIFERGAVALISDEFELSELERGANIKAWADTFDYYGGLHLSPPQALMMDYAGIFMTRAAKPKTQKKLVTLKEKIIGKIANMKWKKNALFGRGKNSKRENDIREEESAEPEKDGNGNSRS